uniref:Nucleotidyltransferase domain-containing protein n=1 Tax=Candidatus Kentrum sp. TUN TaxID=2126343 RepID=A0A451A7U7_9GAMM|nr:MAG: Nucleotidyltransferase domain-containing protein [Candidatus Kentron sp. TUN]VFK62100.1 MAG: Nucleotidyltransferase domain-containing protein [Candidatus Kentron sp. TUN]
MKYISLLRNTDSFKKRNEDSLNRIQHIQEAFEKILKSKQYRELEVSIFCGGSLGRGDAGKESDLDLFILSNKEGKDIRRMDTLKLLADAININEKLKYPEFSNDGQYFKVYSFPDMFERLGSPNDDVDNLFTVRMLLLLESRPIFNKELYEAQIDKVLDHYFRDSSGKDSFHPLFLMNDILRYWRTVCLNYELVRNDPRRPWRKKNINLKFSRMLTIFGTILPLISGPASTKKNVGKLKDLTPIERLAQGLDYLNDDSILERFENFLKIYEEFIKLKESMGSKVNLDDASIDEKVKSNAKEVKNNAEEFSKFLYECLMHENIKEEYKRYLVL